MNSDARFSAAKTSPHEHGHAQVDCSGVNGVEFTMQFEILFNAHLLCNGNHIEGKLFENAGGTKHIGLG